MRLGLYIATGDGAPLDRVLARFARAEAAGFDSAWVGQVFDYDALTLLALAGRATRSIALGSWVIPTFPRHPLALAQQALSVQVACGGRFQLGVGVSHRAVIEKRMGLAYQRPLRHAEEYLRVLRPLLAGDSVDFSGEVFRVRARVEIETPAPPLLLAALGPRMLELAAARADAVGIWLGAAPFLESFVLPRLRAAAHGAERPLPRIVCALPLAVTDRVADARRAAAAFLARSSRLPAYRSVLERQGAGNPADVALIGGPAQIESGLARLAELGVTDFIAVLFPIPEDPEASARSLATLGPLDRFELT